MSAVTATSATASSTTTNSSNTMLVSGDEFLTILVAQLQHQDPLDPTDANQFVTELAQLSQVQYLTNIDSSIEDLSSVTKGGSMGQLASTIGGYMVVDDKATSVGDRVLMTPKGAYDEVTLNLIDSNGDTKSVTYDSSDTLMYEVTDGSYTVAGATASLNGLPVGCSTNVYRYIAGVQSGESGNLLVASDGTAYSMSQVDLITK